MNRFSLPWKKLLHAALLVVLVAAQSGAIAHEVTHWDQTAQELCGTCSLSTHLESSAITEVQFVYSYSSENLIVCEVSGFLHRKEFSLYSQRAPPVSL